MFQFIRGWEREEIKISHHFVLINSFLFFKVAKFKSRSKIYYCSSLLVSFHNQLRYTAHSLFCLNTDDLAKPIFPDKDKFVSYCVSICRSRYFLSFDTCFPDTLSSLTTVYQRHESYILLQAFSITCLLFCYHDAHDNEIIITHLKSDAI